MIKLSQLINEAEVFTAKSKETGKTSVFKSKDARDAAIKAGTHEKRKGDKDGAVQEPGKKDKPKVNIFDKPKKDKEQPKSEPKSQTSNSFSDDDIEDALEDSVQLDDFLDSNKDKISKKDFQSLKSLKGAIQALEGDIVDAEEADDEEQMDEYESELQQNKEEATAILNKYKTTSPPKGTSGTSTTIKNSIKKIVTKGRKGNISPSDLKDFGTKIADDLAPEQKAKYDKLVNNLFQASDAKNNAPNDKAYFKASDAYGKAHDAVYDYLDSIIKPKEEPKKDGGVDLSTPNSVKGTGQADPEVNKAIRKAAQKAGISPKKLGKEEYEKKMAQAAVEALTDSNFHTEARWLVADLEGKPELREKPDYPKFDDKDYDKKMDVVRAKYASKYADDVDDDAYELGIKSANEAGWGGATAIEGLVFDLKMNGSHKLANTILKSFKDAQQKQEGTIKLGNLV